MPGGGEIATLSTSEAYAALEEAKANLAAAQAQVEQERMQLQAAVDSAWRAVENTQLDAGDGTLQYQVQEATIYAPIAGVVTSVDVQEGDIPQGRILSIADDSRLIIRSNVREADVPKIAVGNRVVFTSTATGKKEYTGRVLRISPAAGQGGGGEGQNLPGMGGMGGDAGGGVTFPVEIEVTGNTEGLLLGGSARAEIITQESDKAISVPLDAVYEDEGTKKVLVLATGDGERSGTLEEREVTTGTENDIDVAITGGDLKPGDIVINWPEDFRDRVGEKVDITDDGFDPADVDKARDSSKRTTATVTVTSTRAAN
ncbi:HlyD family efflux transporter periplasmic adaptor subunit [Corynebacterium aquatimens]|nr:HlyD family efflux transporter periplasmic adaptor subunit [Corynebacterium aquatimens]